VELPITLTQALFCVIAFIVVASAALVVLVRNIFHSLLFLAFCFLGVAGVFLFLSADFVAAVQVLIYFGAVVVLLMFALMMTHRVMQTNISQTVGQWWVAAPVTAGILTLLFRLFVSYDFGLNTPNTAPTTAIIGKQLLVKWLLPFEIASVVLLVAMIGAIVLAKEEKDGTP